MIHEPPTSSASTPVPALPPAPVGAALPGTSGRGLPVGWALLGVTVCAATLAAALAWGLGAWLSGAAALVAPLAAALAVLAAALPMAALALKGVTPPRPPTAPTMDFDASTGATTKALFLDLAEREWARSRRYGTGAALLLVEVDRAARLAEVHGPEAADTVLRELARQTAATLRGADALARFGKTQLAVFLAQADATGALDVAERIRERSEQFDLPLQGTHRLRATVSVGVAQLRAAHLNLQALIADAEDATAAARQAGGNCVRAAPVDRDRLSAPGTERKDFRARPQ